MGVQVPLLAPSEHPGSALPPSSLLPPRDVHRRFAEDHYEVLDFNRESGWAIPAERGDTPAGPVFSRVDRVPRRRESVVLPGYEIVVVEVSGNRITEARARRVEETSGAREEA